MKVGRVESGGAGGLPFGETAGEQSVELALAIGERMQLLPIAGVIAGQLGAYGRELRLQLAYIRLQCLHAPHQPAPLTVTFLVLASGRGGSPTPGLGGVGEPAARSSRGIEATGRSRCFASSRQSL